MFYSQKKLMHILAMLFTLEVLFLSPDSSALYHNFIELWSNLAYIPFKDDFSFIGNHLFVFKFRAFLAQFGPFGMSNIRLFCQLRFQKECHRSQISIADSQQLEMCSINLLIKIQNAGVKMKALVNFKTWKFIFFGFFVLNGWGEGPRIPDVLRTVEKSFKCKP